MTEERKFQNEDPLFDPKLNRVRLLPIIHDDIWEMYQKARDSFWVVSEVDLGDDHFEDLSQDEQSFILKVLEFFVPFDFIVNENLDSFTEEVQITEAKMFYHFQEAIEDIHTFMYHTFVEKYVKDEKTKNRIYNEPSPGIVMKAEWARKVKVSGDLVERLIIFLLVEGLLFPASFAAIFFFKKRGKLPGLCFSNELIARDEGLHRDFAILMYKRYINNKLPFERLKELVESAITLEDKFIEECLPVNLIGMNKDMLCTYVRYVANKLVYDLEGVYINNITENPLSFMEMIGTENKTNFFEKKVSNYKKIASNEEGTNTYDFSDVDF